VVKLFKFTILKKFLLFILLLSSYGCSTTYLSYEIEDNPSLIPLKSNAGVKLYFENEIPKDTAYSKIKVIAISEAGFKGESKKLAIQMKTEAIKLGIDAIINIKRIEFSEEEYTLTDMLLGSDHMTTKYYGQLYGLGIKYHKNINYLDRLVKTEEGYLLKNGDEIPIFTVHLNTLGELDSLITFQNQGLSIHDNYHYKYSRQHLVFEKHKWKHSSLHKGKLKRQLYKVDDWPIKNVVISYYDTKKIKQITITDLASLNKEKVLFEYQKFNVLKSKKIVQSNGTEIYEEFEYNDERKLISKTTYRLSSEEKTPFYKVYYHYYSNEYLSKLLDLEEQRLKKLEGQKTYFSQY